MKSLTRRELFWTMGAASGAGAQSAVPLIVPIRRILDSRAKCTPAQYRQFWSTIWPEAYGNFSRAGIQLRCSDTKGEIKQSPGGRPIFVGLEQGVLNLVFTDHIPMNWDRGRSGAGVTTLYDGYHVCLVAMGEAHGNQVPYISVNTCVHELLHALVGDIFVRRATWYQAGGREFRADWYATRLWLFHDGSALRELAAAYLERLRRPAATRVGQMATGLLSC
jgi:hypothetical protein